MILGLDISTSCTGWCIIDASGKLIGMGSISLSKDKSIFKKAQKVKRELSRLNIEYDIENLILLANSKNFYEVEEIKKKVKEYAYQISSMSNNFKFFCCFFQFINHFFSNAFLT